MQESHKSRHFDRTYRRIVHIVSKKLSTFANEGAERIQRYTTIMMQKNEVSHVSRNQHISTIFEFQTRDLKRKITSTFTYRLH